jgi:hypothetical protein
MLNKTKNFLIKNKGSVALCGTILVASFDASAFTAPVNGDAGFNFFDVIDSDILQGGIGAGVGLLGFIAATALLTMGNYKMAGTALLGTTMLGGVKSLATSFGATILML